MKPATINNENTTSTVPAPENQIPLVLFLKSEIAIPYNTPTTPERNMPITTGISTKLWRYLNFTTVTVPVAGSAANPADKSNEMTKNRKNTKKGIVLYANDFKFDNSPIVGKKPNYERLKEIAKSKRYVTVESFVKIFEGIDAYRTI